MIEIPWLTLEIGLPESFQFSIHRGHRGCPRGERWSRHPHSLDRPGDRSRRIDQLQGKWSLGVPPHRCSIGDPALKGFPVMDLLNSSRFILVHFCCLLTDDHFSDGKRKIHWCGSQKSWAWNKEAMGTVA
jgi:hypothetical protein